ncbi:restriction endonuclease fold toxin 5 domain-containing protein [Denitromonas sp.]|uniref:restriction endonuclease fold toxin 5 domain-containing protein n=1 Tax=Denitromonas sp. TaxID=2734609 RepID=UPI003A8AAC69
MASLAIPTIEAVALRVLAAMGVGVATGVADQAAREQVRKRQEAAENAKSAPISRAEAPTGERKKCAMCPPDCGVPFNRSTAGWSEESVAYQARIGGLPVGPGFITEWQFNGVTFDGFDSGQCLLKEAKARYDQFFDEWGEFKYLFQEKIFIKMIKEAVSQNNAAVPKPPTHLQWSFMEPVSYRYMSKVLLQATPEIEVLYRP